MFDRTHKVRRRNMSDLYNRIMELCAAKGISGYELCRATKTNPSTLTDLKMGQRKSLTTDCLSRFAFYLDVSMEHLLGKEQKKARPRLRTGFQGCRKCLLPPFRSFPTIWCLFCWLPQKKRGRFSALPSLSNHMLFRASRIARFTRSSPVSFIMRWRFSRTSSPCMERPPS